MTIPKYIFIKKSENISERVRADGSAWHNLFKQSSYISSGYVSKSSMYTTSRFGHLTGI